MKYDALIEELVSEGDWEDVGSWYRKRARRAARAIVFQRAKIQELERQLANCKDVRASLNARVEAARKVS